MNLGVEIGRRTPREHHVEDAGVRVVLDDESLPPRIGVHDQEARRVTHEARGRARLDVRDAGRGRVRRGGSGIARRTVTDDLQEALELRDADGVDQRHARAERLDVLARDVLEHGPLPLRTDDPHAFVDPVRAEREMD